MGERFETFSVLINTISRSIYKIKTAKMAEFNLKSSHVSCIYYLYRSESMTASELCEACAEDKANISRSIKYLEENGFVTCHSNATKRYSSPLFLTEKGLEVAKSIAERIDTVLDLASQGLSEENRKIMYESLAIISHNLMKICRDYD